MRTRELAKTPPATWWHRSDLITKCREIIGARPSSPSRPEGKPRDSRLISFDHPRSNGGSMTKFKLSMIRSARGSFVLPGSDCPRPSAK